MEQRKAEAADRLAKQKQDRILRNMAKRNKKSFFKRYKKELMGAGVVFVAVYAACVLVGLTQRDLNKLTVNDSQLIKQHNESVKGQEDNTFYTLKENEFFDGMTLAQAQTLFQMELTDQRNNPICNTVNIDKVNPPDSYNFYTAEPGCAFEETQTKAATSYIEVPLSVYRNRRCKFKAGDDFAPSLDYYLNCYNKPNRGRDGGVMLRILDQGNKKGHMSSTCWEELRLDDPNACPTQEDLDRCFFYKQSGYCILQTTSTIKKEITTSGPVVSLMRPTDALLRYGSGVLDADINQPGLDGYQAVKLVGWDQDEVGNEWWLVDPMWGKNYGENGLVKVRIGGEGLLLDQVAITLYPQMKGGVNF